PPLFLYTTLSRSRCRRRRSPQARRPMRAASKAKPGTRCTSENAPATATRAGTVEQDRLTDLLIVGGHTLECGRGGAMERAAPGRVRQIVDRASQQLMGEDQAARAVGPRRLGPCCAVVLRLARRRPVVRRRAQLRIVVRRPGALQIRVVVRRPPVRRLRQPPIFPPRVPPPRPP